MNNFKAQNGKSMLFYIFEHVRRPLKQSYGNTKNSFEHVHWDAKAIQFHMTHHEILLPDHP